MKEIELSPIVKAQLVKIIEEDRKKQEPAVEKAKQIWLEGMKILRGKDDNGIKSNDPGFTRIHLYSQAYLKRRVSAGFLDFDFLAQRSVRNRRGNNKTESYFFFPSGVVKETKISWTNPRGIERKRHLATVEELDNLLQDLRQSKKVAEQIARSTM